MRAWTVWLCLLGICVVGCEQVSRGGPSGELGVFDWGERLDLARWTVGYAERLELGTEGRGLPLGRIVDAVALPDHIVIADGTTLQLLFVTPDGELAFSQGGAGEGPGEYSHIGQVVRAGADRILAWDEVRSRVTMLDLDGTVVGVTVIHTGTERPVRSRRLVGTTAEGNVALFEEKPWISEESDGFEERREKRRYIFIDLETGQRIYETFIPGREIVRGTAENMLVSESVLFGRDGFAAVTSEGAVFGTSDSLFLEVVRPEGGETCATLVDSPPLPVQEAWVSELRTELLEEARADLGSRSPVLIDGEDMIPRMLDLREDLIRQLPARTHLPAFSDLRTDASGNVWVRGPLIPGEALAPWIVFDSSLHPVAYIELPASADVMDIGLRTLLTREAGAWGEPIIVVQEVDAEDRPDPIRRQLGECE